MAGWLAWGSVLPIVCRLAVFKFARVALRYLTGYPLCKGQPSLVVGQFRLPPQVGAGDDPGQDAQPLPHSAPVALGVYCVAPRFLLGAGPAPVRESPAGLARWFLFFLFSHILS